MPPVATRPLPIHPMPASDRTWTQPCSVDTTGSEVPQAALYRPGASSDGATRIEAPNGFDTVANWTGGAVAATAVRSSAIHVSAPGAADCGASTAARPNVRIAV